MLFPMSCSIDLNLYWYIDRKLLQFCQCNHLQYIFL